MSQALETLTEAQKAAFRGAIGAADVATVTELVTDAETAATDAEIAAAIAVAAAASGDYLVAKREALRAAAVSAAGDPARIAVLLTVDDAVTYAAAAPTIATITPSIGPVFTADPKVAGDGDVAQATFAPTGIRPGQGLASAIGAIVPDLLDFSMEIVFVQPPIFATYATIAAMNAAAGAVPEGAIVFCTSAAAPITNTTPFGVNYGQPPLDTFLGLGDADGNNNRGYWLRRSAPFADFVRYTGLSIAGMYLNAAPGTNRCQISEDSLGRHSAFVFQTAIGFGAADLRKIDALAYRPGKPQSLGLRARDGMISLFWNGIEVDSTLAVPTFIPDLLSLFGEQQILALCVTHGCDHLQMNAVSNVLADRFGGPRVTWSDTVDLIVVQDQSRWSASPGSTVGDLNRPDSISGYNGETRPRDTGDGIGISDSKQYNPTQELTPGLYCHSIIGDPRNIGPFKVTNGLGGTYGTAHTFSGSQSETGDAGLWAQYRKHGGGNHLLILGATIGGYSHAQMIAKEAGSYIHSLLSRTTLNPLAYPRDALNRTVKAASQWARRRGQTLRLIAVVDMQAETDCNIAGISAVREADLRSWYTDELTKMVDVSSPPPVFITKAPNRCFDGVSINTNDASTFWRDDEQRQIGEHRDTTFRLRTYTNMYAHTGRFVHDTAYAERLIGEAVGDVIGRALFGFDDKPVYAVSTVRSGSNIIVTMSEPVDLVQFCDLADGGRRPTLLGWHMTGGFKTYGFVYTDVGGAKTINGDVTLNGAGLVFTIPISGGGAGAGDYLDTLGTNALFTNIRARQRRYGEFNDQLWPAAFPYAAASPRIAEGGKNDITQWASAQHVVLA